MYRIYADGAILHNPNFSEEGRVVIDPVLKEKVNTHGSLQFDIAPDHPLYGKLEPRKTLIRVVSDSANNKQWFGRVVSMSRGWKNVLSVYCEGELACLCDSLKRPFGFTGTPSDLLSSLITTYTGSDTDGYAFQLGNVSVTDPNNNNIVRSSSEPMSVWECIESKLVESSLGGYILPRYDEANDIHYIDYLILDDNDTYSRTSTQTIEFGKNLLDFTQTWDASSVMTVIVPYGANKETEAQPPTNGQWDGNRITIESVNDGKDYLENSLGKQMYGRVVGSHTWDDVTVPANLKTKATAWLAQQIWQSVTLEISAVDLAFVNADIEQIQVGEYVRCKSKMHDLDVLLLCTEKETHLTQLEDSSIILGAGLKTITDLQGKDVK